MYSNKDAEENVTFSPTLDGFLNFVNETVAHYKDLTDANAREIVETLKKALMTYSIKLAYEHLSCLERYNKIREEFTASKDVIFSKEITTLEQIPQRFRFVLSTNRYKANFKHPLVRQANGLVCQVIMRNGALCCELLAIPPNDFNPRYTMENLDKLLKGGIYDVYHIQDGTTINMYYDKDVVYSKTVTSLVSRPEGDILQNQKTYYRGRWIISTKNAIESDTMEWRGYEYGTVINDVLKKYPAFSLANLATTHCYSMGFKHPAYHPFKQPAEWRPTYFTGTEEPNLPWIKTMWFIHSCDLQTCNTSTTTNIGLPLQTKATERLDLSTMMRRVENAAHGYLNQKQEPFLGYIFRAHKEEDTQEYSDILVESSLWGEIRKAIYQLPFISNKEVRDKQEQNFKNMTYIILDAYLNFHKRRLFIALFPQFAEQHEKYRNVITQVVEKIHQNMLNNRKAVKPAVETSKETTAIDHLARRFEDIVQSQYRSYKPPVNSAGRGKHAGQARSQKDVIRNLITHPKYIDIYFQQLHDTM